ncbi:MAG: citrate lyase acyl carrier protein [Bacillota bacterium]
MTKPIITGSLESSDCMVTLFEADPPVIEIDTIVHDAFHDHIKQLVESILSDHSLSHLSVRLQDKGALDYAIRARLETAIARYKGETHG